MKKNILFSIVLFFSAPLFVSGSEQERVMAAIQTGDVTHVDAALSRIMQQNNRGDLNFPQLLTYAICASTCDIVRCLIQARGCAITIEDALVTVRIKDPEMLKLLVNQSDQDTKILRCFLEVAIIKGWNDVLRYLIEQKKTPLIINTKRKSLAHFTAEYGTYETMKVLLGLDPRLVKYPYTGNYVPLHDAAKYGKLKIVQLLVGTYGVAISPVFNPIKRTPLHYAAREGHLDVVRYLVRMGADIDVKDVFGWTPYEHAFVAKKWAVEKFLKEELERRALHARAFKPRYASSQAGVLPGHESSHSHLGHQADGGKNATAVPESPDAFSGSSQSVTAADQLSYPKLPELRLDVLGQKDVTDSEACEGDLARLSSDEKRSSIFFFPHCWQPGSHGQTPPTDEASSEGSTKRPRVESESDEDLPASSSSISERVKRRHAKRQASR